MPNGGVVSRSVIHIVWSPRRIEESLQAHEALGLETAFICGYTEHEGCAVANRIIEDTDADIYLLSYDDQCPTPQQTELVLTHQHETGQVVSGWQRLGMDSPYASATHPTWGTERHLTLDPECFYQAEQVRQHTDELIPTLYFAALTATPRDLLLESPIRALPSYVQGEALNTWPSRDGQPYDKGCCSDWTLAIDIANHGHPIWIARDAEIKHLSPQHGIPHHPFTNHEDDQGVFWNHRPRQPKAKA